MNEEKRRRGFRERIVERWTPLFTDDVEIAALTVEEFAAACGWDELRADGVVREDEEPMALAGLRLSSIFPRHLLRIRDDGRLVPIDVEDAVALVRLTLAQGGRSAVARRTTPDQPATAVSLADAQGVTAEGDGDASGRDEAARADEGGDDGRRRFPFRRRD